MQNLSIYSECCIRYERKTAAMDAPQWKSYPVISIEADNIQYDICCIQSAIRQKLNGCYPPPSTPVDELTVNAGEFVIMVSA